MEKTRIEYCDSSVNFVTGCYNTCPYCYARRMVTRFSNVKPEDTGEGNIYVLEKQPKKSFGRFNPYPYGFAPTLHEYRFAEFGTKHYGKTIFVCTMSDLFGGWVPDEWIEKVFHCCEEHPGHRYLFLTKNPKRYVALAKAGKLPKRENFWYGSTTVNPRKNFFVADGYHTFVSIEPIMEPFTNGDCRPDDVVSKVDWIIIGAETGNRKDKVVPKREWVEEIVKAAQRHGKPVFMKDSMIPIWGEEILRELPWSAE